MYLIDLYTDTDSEVSGDVYTGCARLRIPSEEDARKLVEIAVKNGAIATIIYTDYGDTKVADEDKQ